MYKSIFMYSLLAFGYFVFSTIPVTEVSAQGIAVTSGNNQETTQGQNFPNAVTFTATDASDNPVGSLSLSCTAAGCKISTTKTGTYTAILTTEATDSAGELTLYVKANAASFYDFGSVLVIGTIGGASRNVRFTGTITDVLYFSSASDQTKITSTTRSVAEGTAANTNIGAPVSATHWANVDIDTTNDVTLTYSLEGDDAASFDIDTGTGQLKTKAALDYEMKTTYSVKVKVEEKSTSDGLRSDDTIDVTIDVTDVDESLLPPDPEDPPGQQSPQDPEDSPGQQSPQDQLVNPQSAGNTQTPGETEPATEQTPPKRKIRYECPVGWTRDSVFRKTKKALIYKLKVNVDRTNRRSIYELESLAIYVHPDENLETLEGWTLQIGTRYNNFGKEFKLTAENSVIDEHDFAYIENPEETPIPMRTLDFISQSLPNFDYRLYDAQGTRVDFGISCYKEGGLTFRLWNTKDPRVIRVLPFEISEEALSVRLKALDWNTPFFRTEWTAAIMPDLPEAPRGTFAGEKEYRRHMGGSEKIVGRDALKIRPEAYGRLNFFHQMDACPVFFPKASRRHCISSGISAEKVKFSPVAGCSKPSKRACNA